MTRITRTKLDSAGWTLNILPYGAESPLENHHSFELGADDENREIWASEIIVRLYGTRSIETACIAYANKRNHRAS